MTQEFQTGGFIPRPHTVASYIPLSREFDLTFSEDMRRVIDLILDRRARPWRYADRNPMPEIVLFPRLAKVGRWLTRRVRP